MSKHGTKGIASWLFASALAAASLPAAAYDSLFWDNGPKGANGEYVTVGTSRTLDNDLNGVPEFQFWWRIFNIGTTTLVKSTSKGSMTWPTPACSGDGTTNQFLIDGWRGQGTQTNMTAAFALRNNSSNATCNSTQYNTLVVHARTDSTTFWVKKFVGGGQPREFTRVTLGDGTPAYMLGRFNPTSTTSSDRIVTIIRESDGAILSQKTYKDAWRNLR